MKKFSFIALLLIMVLFFTSCGDNEKGAGGSKAESGNQQQESITEEQTTAYQPMDFESLPDNPASDFEYHSLYGTLFISGYIGESKIVKIPAVIDNTEVKVIGDSAFAGLDITHVYIPDTVLEMRKSCFLGCSNLKEVRLSENISGINECTFMDCSSLVKVDIPDNVKYIGDGAFNSCKSLKAFEAPSALNSIGERAFAYSGYNKVDLSATDSLEYIGQFAFQECLSLKSVIFSPIMDLNSDDMYGAFSKCSTLSDFSVAQKAYVSNPVVTVEDNVLYCGNSVFAAAPANTVRDITIRDGVTEIREFAFSTSNIESIKIPDSCTYIAKGAFKYCSSLKNVNLGNGIKTLEQMAFSECYALKEVVLPESVKELEYEAFAYTNIEKVVINSTDLSESDDFTDVFKGSNKVNVVFNGKTFTPDQFDELNALAGI